MVLASFQDISTLNFMRGSFFRGAARPLVRALRALRVFRSRPLTQPARGNLISSFCSGRRRRRRGAVSALTPGAGRPRASAGRFALQNSPYSRFTVSLTPRLGFSEPDVVF
ncbi:hypothetical protein EVAR_60608_1 [Eumeta japonica]|uniref:Uncharacterized protein n=1 Tax=Eumeta variegata TaxID=151549 RepID=A0A4C1YEF6_EUMVA|nr:hypothetical protein EVAR_60608_1 [Eumeta japonica]